MGREEKTILQKCFFFSPHNLFLFLTVTPIEGPYRTSVDTFTAVGTAGCKTFIEFSSDTSIETAFLGSKQRLIDHLFADFDTDIAFDTLTAILNDERMTGIVHQFLLFAADGFGVTFVTFAVLAELAIMLVGAGTFNTPFALGHHGFGRHGNRGLFESRLAFFDGDHRQFVPFRL